MTVPAPIQLAELTLERLGWPSSDQWLERRGALTVQVTVSSFSSYVAFLEGYARALAAAEANWDRAHRWLRNAISSTRVDVGAHDRIAFPNARTDRDISRLAEEVFTLP